MTSTGAHRCTSIGTSCSTSSRSSSCSARSTSSWLDPSASARVFWFRRSAPRPCAPATASSFTRADALLKELSQARADHTYERVFRRYLAPDLLILDDFALHRLSAQQSEDLYDLIIERHRRASFALTSNRGVDEWLGLFDNPILGNSSLDRLANAAHQLVIEGPSYRAKLAPKHRIADDHVVREEVVPTP